MKITLYLVPEDNEGRLIKEFLRKNNIMFKEIITDNLRTLQKVVHFPIQRKVSLLEIKYSSSIHVINGFIERDLKQLIEHINKYKIKIRYDENKFKQN